MGKKIIIQPYTQNTREGRRLVRKHERNQKRVKKLKEYQEQVKNGLVKYNIRLEEK